METVVQPSVVSLFAGIGGFDLGFERAGFRIVGHVEKDVKCRELLQAKWPDAVCLDDVCTAGAHNLPPCDVVTFGFPCQDLSVAGKRAGLAGGRSGLFYEATRIIDELKPAYCLFENVPGLLSSDGGRDFWRVLRQMDEIGYHGAWRTLDAQWFGVAQRRRRVFGLFSRLDSGAERCAQVLSLGESLRGHPAPSRETGKVAPCLAASGVGAGRTGNERNEVDFCIEQAVPLGTTPWDGQRARIMDINGVCQTMQSGAKTSGNVIPAVAYREVAPALTGNYGKQPDNSDTALGPNIVGQVNMQGSKGMAVTDEAKPAYTLNAMHGHDVHAVAFAQNTRDEVREMSVVGALAAEPGMKQTSYLRQAMSVRRLTPTECERLQGFPDGWTAGFSDSTRYKMLGNAVCVKVSEWIAFRLNPRFTVAALH